MKLHLPGIDALRSAVYAAAAAAALTVPAHGITYFTHVTVASDAGGEPLEKAIADINGDGKKDLIVGMGNAYGAAGMYWWQFPASGNPTDAWTKHTIIGTGAFYEHSQIFDVNGDGFPDIICSYAADGSIPDSSVVWFQHPGGDGSGTWTVHNIASGIGHEVRLADIDGDGKMDVVTSRTRNVNFQNSPTSWSSINWGAAASGSAQDGMALLDIGSGKGAVNIVGNTTTGIYWFENPRETGGNARTGTWIAHLIASNDTGGPTLVTGDFDGDGRMDIVQVPNEAAQGTQGLIWYSAPADRRTGTWTKHTIDTTWQAVHWIEVADVDNDGHLDLIISEQEQAHDPSGGPYTYNNDRVAVYYGDGAGHFTPQILENTGCQNVVSSDLSGDGDLDFFACNHGVFGAPHPVELWVNNLHGSASGGALTGTVATAATTTYNLTSLGTADWAHWNGTYIHKSSGGGKISDVTRIGITPGVTSGAYGTFNQTTRNVGWSDGTPTGSNGDDQNYIWCNGQINAGWTFTVPADTTTRTLNILYGGATGAQVTLVAALSDASAPEFISTTTISSSNNLLATLIYHGVEAGQKLTVTLNKVGDSGSPSVDLDAAWLTASGNPALQFETENLTVAGQTAGITHRLVSDSRYSNGVGTILDSNAVGNFVTYVVPGLAAGNYDLQVGVKNFTGRGIWQCAVAAHGSTSFTNHGLPYDEYTTAEVFTYVDLGVFTLGSSGDKDFKFTITGKNASSAGYGESFDYIRLIPQ